MSKLIPLYTRYPLREKRGTVSIYGDESSHTAHKFMALGALITNEPHEVLEMELSKVKARYHLSSEVKWTKMPTQGKFLDGYKALVESFVTLPIRYKVFIIDTVKHPLAHDV